MWDIICDMTFRNEEISVVQVRSFLSSSHSRFSSYRICYAIRYNNRLNWFVWHAVILKSGYKYVLQYMCMYVYARVRAKKYVADYAAKFITISTRRALVSPNNMYLRATIVSVFIFSRRTTALGNDLVNQIEFRTAVSIPLCT